MKRHNRILLLLTLFLTSINIYSQRYEIKGRVVGDLSNMPIEFVNATLIKNDSIYNGTVTDSLGVFTMKVSKGDYTLKLEYFGEVATNKEINLLSNINLGILKVKESVNLQEIVINAKRKIIKKVGDKLQFDVENSPFSTGNTATELLVKVPKIISDGNDFKIKNKVAKILINGREIHLSSDDLKSYLSTINSENIKKIEVQEIADASQEASTKNGIINIVLKNNPKGFRLTARQVFKYYDKKNNDLYTNFNTQYGNKKFYLYSNFSWNKGKQPGLSSSVFQYPNKESQITTNNFINKRNNINFELGSVFYINSKNKIGFATNYNDRGTAYDEKLDLIYKKPDEKSSIRSRGLSLIDIKSINKSLIINYSIDLDDKGSQLKVISDIGKNDFSTLSRIDTYYIPTSSKDNQRLTKSESKSNYLSSQVDYMQSFINQWQLNAGIKAYYINRHNFQHNYNIKNSIQLPITNKDQDFNNQETILGAYISGSKQWNRHFLKLGLRFENTETKGVNNISRKNIEKLYIDWFPSIYYQFNSNKNLSYFLSYKKNISRPRFGDLNPYIFKINDYRYESGNPKLLPYYTHIFDIGLDYFSNSITLSYESMTDYITNIYTTNSDKVNISMPHNSGRSKIFSLDYTYANDINSWLYANISSGVSYGFYNIGKDHFKGADWYENIVVQAKLPKKWVVELEQKYNSNYTHFNKKIKYYATTDVMIEKKFLDNHLILRLKLEDIFNTNRTKMTSYYKNFYNDFYRKKQTRNIIFSVQYNLENKNKVKSQEVKSSDENKNRL